MCRHHCFPNAVRPASGDATLAGPPRSPFPSARIPEEQPGCRFRAAPPAWILERTYRCGRAEDRIPPILRASCSNAPTPPRTTPQAHGGQHVSRLLSQPLTRRAITLTHEVLSADALLDRSACGHVGNCRTDENETESSQRYNQPRRKRYEENDHEHRNGNNEQTRRGAERMPSHTRHATAEIDGRERLTG